MSRSLLCVALASALLVLAAIPAFAVEHGDDEGHEHRGGRDRSTTQPEAPGERSPAPSDPDGDSNRGEDKPGGEGGYDDDKDGNNGCGNDDDFEDDNKGNCGGPDRERPSDDEARDARPEDHAEQDPSRAGDATRSGAARDGAAPPAPVDPRRETADERIHSGAHLPARGPGSSQVRRVLHLLRVMKAQQYHHVSDGTVLGALLQGWVAFLEQQQLSLGIPGEPPASHATDGIATGPTGLSHDRQGGVEVLGGVLTGDGGLRGNDAITAAGETEEATTVAGVLATAAGAMLLLTALTIATLGAGSLLVGRSRD